MHIDNNNGGILIFISFRNKSFLNENISVHVNIMSDAASVLGKSGIDSKGISLSI